MLWHSLQFYACETVLEEQGVYGGRLGVLGPVSQTGLSLSQD